MPLPTLISVITELDKLQSSKKHAVAKRAREFLQELRTITSENENAANTLGNKLRNAIINPRKNDLLVETIYRILLVVTLICPRNKCEEGQPIDPISLEPIEAHYLFISLDRFQWSILELGKYIQATNQYTNPITRLPFTAQDIKMMKIVALQANIPSPLVTTERLNQVQVVESNRALCFPLFRFFSAPTENYPVAFQNSDGGWEIPPRIGLNSNWDL